MPEYEDTLREAVGQMRNVQDGWRKDLQDRAFARIRELEGRDGLRLPDGTVPTCHVFTSCRNPVVSFREDDELGAVPYCAEHDHPDLPLASLMNVVMRDADG